MNLILRAMIPLLGSIFVIILALRPDLFVKEEKRDFFIKYRWAWLFAGTMLVIGNAINLVLKLMEG